MCPVSALVPGTSEVLSESLWDRTPLGGCGFSCDTQFWEEISQVDIFSSAPWGFKSKMMSRRDVEVGNWKKCQWKRRDLNYQSVYLFRTRRNTWKHYMKGETLHFVQLLSCVQFLETPWTAAHQASLSFTIIQSSLKLLSIESVMPSNHPILCHPFSSCLQSFSASQSFPMSWVFASSGQSIGTSASVQVLPMNLQGWFSLGLTSLISLLSQLYKNK